MSEESTTPETPTESSATESSAESVAESAAESAVPTKPEQSEADLAKAYDVEEFMRDVIDPELGINVVDLGLVYDIYMVDGTHAVIDMTLTSPACPLTEEIEDQAEAAVVGGGVAEKLTINWVWMPAWGPHMITEDGRDQLRALGFSV